jgi:L-fuconolactonase
VHIIDAHQHIWDLRRARYDWLTPALQPINRSYGMEEAYPEQRHAGVTASILVQAADSFADTELMLEAAAQYPSVVGVVGYVPLERPDIAAEELARLRRDPILVGIRNLIHDQADADYLVRPAVMEGLQVLADADVPFDLVSVLPRHLEHLLALVDRLPTLRVVIDHLSKPPIGKADRQPWWDLIGEVAAHPQVFAKVSGLYPVSNPMRWSTDSIRPFVERAFEVFGADRLMYGGDWPVSVLAGGYTTVWKGLRPFFDELSPVDRAAVLGGTATQFYRLPPERLARASTG